MAHFEGMSTRAGISVQIGTIIFCRFSKLLLVGQELAIPLIRLNSDLNSTFNAFDIYIRIGFELTKCNLELRELDLPYAERGILTNATLRPHQLVATVYVTLVHDNL